MARAAQQWSLYFFRAPGVPSLTLSVDIARLVDIASASVPGFCALKFLGETGAGFMSEGAGLVVCIADMITQGTAKQGAPGPNGFLGAPPRM